MIYTADNRKPTDVILQQQMLLFLTGYHNKQMIRFSLVVDDLGLPQEAAELILGRHHLVSEVLVVLSLSSLGKHTQFVTPLTLLLTIQSNLQLAILTN